MNNPSRTFYRSRETFGEGPCPFNNGGNNGQHLNGGNNGQHHQQQQQIVDDMTTPSIRVTQLDAQVFGQDIHDKLQALEPPRAKAPRDFVPNVKSVDELFEEDEKLSANYATTIADDDAIEVDCGGRELAKLENWSDAGFPDALMANIKRSGYIKPRQIQCSVVPLILDGYDVIGHADTGSGKTAAYLIPTISECIEAKANGTYKSDGGYPFCVIIAPTRELVRQCYEQASKFAHDTGVSVAQSYGEIPMKENLRLIYNPGCDILCISPGRFKHLSDGGYIGFNKLRFLIFDEGDHLLTSQYMDDIRPILELPSFPNGKLRQTLFFSATFTEEMLESAKQFMRPDGFRALVSNHRNVVNKRCIQEFVAHDLHEKFIALIDFLRAELEKVENDVDKFPRTLIFCNTREYCEKLATALCYSGITAVPLSGMRAQDLREKAFDDFRSSKIACLLVTDICARGIDIKELDLVVNFDMPHDYDTYIHRAGRVGRIRPGKCISYVSLGRSASVLMEIKAGMEQSGHMVPPSLVEVLNQVQEAQAAKNSSRSRAQVEELPVEIASAAEEILNQVPEAVVEKPSPAEAISGKVQEASSIPPPLQEGRTQDEEKPTAENQPSVLKQVQEAKIEDPALPENSRAHAEEAPTETAAVLTQVQKTQVAAAEKPVEETHDQNKENSTTEKLWTGEVAAAVPPQVQETQATTGEKVSSLQETHVQSDEKPASELPPLVEALLNQVQEAKIKDPTSPENYFIRAQVQEASVKTPPPAVAASVSPQVQGTPISVKKPIRIQKPRTQSDEESTEQAPIGKWKKISLPPRTDSDEW